MHARSYVFITYKNVSGSFETPYCFRNVRTLHELVCVRKVVSRSLHRFLLVKAYTRKHAHESMHIGESMHMKACTPKPAMSLGTLLSPNQGCENTFCFLTPSLLAVLHVLLPLLPSFKTTFRVVRWTRSKNEMFEFFFPFSYKLSKKSK